MNNAKPDRCPVYKKCGGCQLDTSYPDQLRFKQAKVSRLLGRFCKPEPIIGMEVPYHYRNKVQAAFYTDKRGRIISGVYQSGTHHVVGIDSCRIEDETADRIITGVRGLLPSFRLTTYNEDTGKGFLRHVLVRRGFQTGEVMLVLVTGTPVFPSKNNFVRSIREKFPEITTIVQNVNNLSTNLVLGERQTVLFGKGYIEDVLCGCRFRISPKSFYQINPVQTERLYGKAMEFARLKGNETVLDAYCGIGTDNKAALDLLGTLPNLYGDTTWVPVSTTVEAIRRYGSKKMLFGTDNPIDGPDTLLHNKTGERSLYQQYFHELRERGCEKTPPKNRQAHNRKHRRLCACCGIIIL
ncbi:MAG: 23S rRNA (uracil(1939)-C(5))-methyltransferase RlmD [Ruminococcus sp.]|nr:23S rRNA (uracil(1939)-C(5))-methyltransferase RlmD [Ruminococcus sp.]